MQLKFAVLVAALLSGVAATADQAPEKGQLLSLDEAIKTALVHLLYPHRPHLGLLDRLTSRIRGSRIPPPLVVFFF